MLRELVERLLALPPQAWEQIGWTGEPLRGRLTPAERAALSREAAAYGSALAQKTQREHPGLQPEALVAALGGAVTEIDVEPDADYAMFAWFEAPASITLNARNIARSQALMQEQELFALTGPADLRQLLLAHELYHMLEPMEPEPLSLRFVEMRGFLFGRVRRRVEAPGELAAMAFAQTLCGLSCSPYLFNIVMLYAYHPQRAARLCESYLKYEVLS